MAIAFRKATISDIPQLVSIEEASFSTDCLNAAKFKYFLTKANSSMVVATKGNMVAGYALILFHKHTSLARLYSIAVAPEYRSLKVGLKLMKKIEEFALERGSTYIRLEVKASNFKAIKLYEDLDYRKFSYRVDYYQDHEDAVCYEKKIRKNAKAFKIKVPYYQQKTKFTCGPASLLMAMKAFDQTIKLNVENELQIWREATTIFMTSGHGGCGPHGLALSAKSRGFHVELYLNSKTSLFVEGVRDVKKKEIIQVVQKQFERELKETDVKISYNKYSFETLKTILEKGGVPLVLISAYRLTATKAPHWIVITGIEEDFIYFHDPEVDDHEVSTDNIHIPVSRSEFEKMSKFGTSQLKSIVAVYPKS